MSLARAILQDPAILLLDEPFSNVDVHSAREMVGLLKGMRDAGKTIFVVTHQALLLERRSPTNSSGWRQGADCRSDCECDSRRTMRGCVQ